MAFGESVPVLVLPMGYQRRLVAYRAETSISSEVMKAVLEIIPSPIILGRRIVANILPPRLHENLKKRPLAGPCDCRGSPLTWWNEEVPEPPEITRPVAAHSVTAPTPYM